MSAQSLSPVSLRGEHVHLEPLSEDHVDGLWAVGDDPELWRWTWAHIASRDDMRRYVRAALDEAAAGQSLPFATCLAKGGRVVGTTRFGAIALQHRRLEIGWTFVARPWQRSAVNTEAKLLMLTHAFETLGVRRLELKTDSKNTNSRRAIARLGAREEGTLREHIITESGRIRDTVYYSILSSEWPDVRTALRARLAAQ